MPVVLLSGFIRPYLQASSEFAKQHGELDIDVVENGRSSLFSLLDRGVVDLVIALGVAKTRDFAYMSLWSERVMVALPQSHPLAEQEFVYWTDLRNDLFLISRYDPGPEIQDILLGRPASPGERPSIKHMGAQHDHLLNFESNKRGILPILEFSIGNALKEVVYREVRDSSGPTRVGYVAYWRNDADNAALKHALAFIRSHPAVPRQSIQATN